MFPYLEKAKEYNFDILILNHNETAPTIETPEKHIEYVWENVVNELKFKNIFIIAHGFGGILTLHLLSKIGNFILLHLSQIRCGRM